jgi:hypothetical protein
LGFIPAIKASLAELGGPYRAPWYFTKEWSFSIDVFKRYCNRLENRRDKPRYQQKMLPVVFPLLAKRIKEARNNQSIGNVRASCLPKTAFSIVAYIPTT